MSFLSPGGGIIMNKYTENFAASFSKYAKLSLVLVLIFGTISIIFGQNNWVSHSAGSCTKGLHCVISTFPGHSAGVCFAVGDSGTILSYSNNDHIWTNRPSGTANDLLGVSGGAIHRVAVGETGTIISTLSGVSWDSQLPTTLITLRAIAGNFIVVGDSGLIITSPNDSIWTTRTSGTTKRLRSICFPSLSDGSNESFTSVGDSGTILTSPDGIAWSSQTSGTTRNLNAVTRGGAYSSGNTVAVGDSGIILTSPDGKIWTSRTSGTTNTLWGIFAAVDIYYFNWILYVAVGERGTILTSSNGFSWAPQISGTTRNLYGATWSVDSIIVVGDSGTIVTSYFRPATGIRQYKTPVKQQLISITNNIIYYTLSEQSRTLIALYDIKGRFVKMFVNRMQQAGSYSVTIPHDVSPGIYTVAFKAGKQNIDKTIVISK
jgi:hypothetical protein